MESNAGFFSSIVNFFAVGGFWMFPIFVAQVVSLAIIAERVVRLYIQRSVNLRSQTQAFEGEIKKGNLDRVLLQARALEAGSSLRNLLEAGIQAAMNMGGREEVQAKMDEVLVKEQ